MQRDMDFQGGGRGTSELTSLWRRKKEQEGVRKFRGRPCLSFVAGGTAKAQEKKGGGYTMEDSVLTAMKRT